MKRSTAMLLVAEVRRHKPGWTAKRCAEWLRGRMPDVREACRKAVRDTVTMGMIEHDIGDAEEGR